jgi:hypothetical protein
MSDLFDLEKLLDRVFKNNVGLILEDVAIFKRYTRSISLECCTYSYGGYGG